MVLDRKRVVIAVLLFVVIFSTIAYFFILPEKVTESNIENVLNPYFDSCIDSTINGSDIYDFNDRIRSYITTCSAMTKKDLSLCEGIQVANSYNYEHETMCNVLTSVGGCIESRDLMSDSCQSLPDERNHLMGILFEATSTEACDDVPEENYRDLCKAVVSKEPSMVCSDPNPKDCEEYIGYLLLVALLDNDISYCHEMSDTFEGFFCEALIDGDWNRCREQVLGHACTLESIVLHKRYGTDRVDCDYFADEGSRIFCEQTTSLFI